jgi:hypothetical protein
MDLTLFDLSALQSLHISYLHLFEDYKNALEHIDEKVASYAFSRDYLNERIHYFGEQIKLVEARIKELSKKELRFSIEYFFYYFGFIKKVIQFHFITTSEAYKKYGPYVTGLIIYTEEEILSLLDKTKKGAHSDGIIKLDDKISAHLSAEMRAELKVNGFLASEVDSIM